MSSIHSITPEKLSRLIGTPKSPLVIDVRTEEDYAADPRLIPGSLRRNAELANGAHEFGARPLAIVCHKGAKISQGFAAYLRNEGASAEVLEGGFVAWRDAKLPLIATKHLPKRDDRNRTLWVTRERPKVDRIACPWLIKRFIDPHAVVMFVKPSEVIAVGERFGAAPFDVEGVFWSHRGELCTFDVMLEEFGLQTEPLQQLADMVRGADTARLDLSPQAAGLLAASLGLSRMYADDLEQLEAGMLLYDAFYRWCRDATEETHNWPSHKAKN
ncbi:MAG: sulfurtransferase/chromate resistance protein [Xanthobacteraceae bacterium]|nr:sulfurtransferase/chromate resistance protein [Xanthobacteraceae bacterium]